MAAKFPALAGQGYVGGADRPHRNRDDDRGGLERYSRRGQVPAKARLSAAASHSPPARPAKAKFIGAAVQILRGPDVRSAPALHRGTLFLHGRKRSHRGHKHIVSHQRDSQEAADVTCCP
jgi:hypothetical protein